jgi:hypothetical protein
MRRAVDAFVLAALVLSVVFGAVSLFDSMSALFDFPDGSDVVDERVGDELPEGVERVADGFWLEWSPDYDGGWMVEEEPAHDVNVSSAPDPRPGVASIYGYERLWVDCGDGDKMMIVKFDTDEGMDMGVTKEALCSGGA